MSLAPWLFKPKHCAPMGFASGSASNAARMAYHPCKHTQSVREDQASARVSDICITRDAEDCWCPYDISQRGHWFERAVQPDVLRLCAVETISPSEMPRKTSQQSARNAQQKQPSMGNDPCCKMTTKMLPMTYREARVGKRGLDAPDLADGAAGDLALELLRLPSRRNRSKTPINHKQLVGCTGDVRGGCGRTSSRP